MPVWEISLEITFSTPLFSKVISIKACLFISFTTSFEVFAPKTVSIAFIIMLLPAPVSPNKTLNPSAKSRRISSIKIKFLI